MFANIGYVVNAEETKNRAAAKEVSLLSFHPLQEGGS